MLKIKMYDCADAAVEDAKAWFKDKFIHGYFNLQSPGDASSGRTRDILGWINVKFLELDQLQGSLICETNPTTCVYPNAQNKALKQFEFLEPMTEEEIKYLEEHDRKYDDFEQSGGERELFIKNKHEYIHTHSPFKRKYNLEARSECLHCGSIFLIKDYKVVANMDIDMICCPHYPYCDGTIIDWMPTKKKSIKVSEYIADAQKNKNEPEPEPEPENIILSECELHANEGLVVFYDENPKEDGLIILAVKMSMYKKMKEHLDEALQPGSMAFIHGYSSVEPAAIVSDARESVIEELLENLEDNCKFAENTIEKIKALGNDVLLQLENDWHHDEIDGCMWENLRDHAERFLANHGEDE